MEKLGHAGRPSLKSAGRETSPRLAVAGPAPLHQSSGPRRIAMVGTGYVGLVTGTCFAQLGNSVVCLDKDSSKIATLARGKVPFFEPQLQEMIFRNHRAGRLAFSDDVEAGVRDSEFVFIAVGTPTASDGNADLSAVREVAAMIGRAMDGPKVVVLKSTVPLGTNEIVASIIRQNSAEKHRVDVASNPEFLREGSAVNDFMHPDRVVVGTSDAHVEALLRHLYAPLGAPIVATDVRTSELIKYAANAFLAMKISFMSEIANICELVDVDVKVLGEGIGLDRRIGTQFMSPGLGYGGSCFPKDVRALEQMARDRDYEARLLRSIETVNRSQVRRNFEKIERALGTLGGKTVCVLGLAFKPNTSDVREAPALHLIDLFLRAGAVVKAHDPIAIDSARERMGDRVAYFTDMYEAMHGCDALVLATEWDEYSGVNFAQVRELMRGDLVFDGRNLFNAEDVIVEGLRYIGVGRTRMQQQTFTCEAYGA